MNTRFVVTWLTLQLWHRLLCSLLLTHHYGPSRSFVGCIVVLTVDSDVSTVTAASDSTEKTYSSDASMDDILSDSITFDLHVTDRNDELHVNIINEDGFLICDGRISSIQQNNGPPINCVHDTKLLKNGENTLFITVFSTRRNSIILQTTRRFNYIKPVIPLVKKKHLVKALKYGVTGLIVTGISVKLVPVLLAVIAKSHDVKPPSAKSVDAKAMHERRGIDFQVVRNPSKADSLFRRPTTTTVAPSSLSLTPTKILQSQPLKYSLALLCLLLVGRGGEMSTKSKSYVSTSPSTSSSSSSRPTALSRKPRRAYGVLLSSRNINSSTSVSSSSSSAVVTPRRRLPSALAATAAAVKPRSEDLIRKLLTSGVILSVQALFIMMQKIGLVGSAQTVASKLSNYFVPLFK